MKQREPISNIMSTELVTVNHTNNLNDVKEIFKKNVVKHLPVVSGDKIIGLISKTDFYRVTYNVGTQDVQNEVNSEIMSTLTIEQVMTKNLETIAPGDTIQDVAAILVEKDFHALPVIENEVLVGIVTTTDIIKYLLEQY